MPRLSASQFEIMNVVWDLNEASINQVMDVIKKNYKKNLSRSTIQVQMRRLEEKGWLIHKKVSRTFVYKARWTRDQAQATIALEVTDCAFGGSSAALVKCLFDLNKISKEELQELRKLLNKPKGD